MRGVWRAGGDGVVRCVRFPSPLVGQGAFAIAKADEGFSPRRQTLHPSRCRFAPMADASIGVLF
jgi:hypothetical protein